MSTEELMVSMYPNEDKKEIDSILIEVLNDKIVLSQGGYPLQPTQMPFYSSLDELQTEYPKLLKNSYKEIYRYNPIKQIEDANKIPPDRLAEIMVMPENWAYTVDFLKESNAFEQVRKAAIILCFDPIYANGKERYGNLKNLPLDTDHFNKSFFTKRAEISRQAKLEINNIRASVERKIDELDWT